MLIVSRDNTYLEVTDNRWDTRAALDLLRIYGEKDTEAGEVFCVYRGNYNLHSLAESLEIDDYAKIVTSDNVTLDGGRVGEDDGTAEAVRRTNNVLQRSGHFIQDDGSASAAGGFAMAPPPSEPDSDSDPTRPPADVLPFDGSKIDPTMIG